MQLHKYHKKSAYMFLFPCQLTKAWKHLSHGTQEWLSCDRQRVMVFAWQGWRAETPQGRVTQVSTCRKKKTLVFLPSAPPETLGSGSHWLPLVGWKVMMGSSPCRANCGNTVARHEALVNFIISKYTNTPTTLIASHMFVLYIYKYILMCLCWSFNLAVFVLCIWAMLGWSCVLCFGVATEA